MGKLGNWVKQNSNYVKLDQGESIEGVYLGFKESQYKGTPLIEYELEVEIEGEKSKKVLSTGSKKLAMRMDNVDFGKNVKITRFGDGYDTTYEVEVISTDEEKAWDES